MDNWISVRNHLPEDDLPAGSDRKSIKCMVVCNHNGLKTVRVLTRQRWETRSGWHPWLWSKDAVNVTHWMLMPKPVDAADDVCIEKLLEQFPNVDNALDELYRVKSSGTPWYSEEGLTLDGVIREVRWQILREALLMRGSYAQIRDFIGSEFEMANNDYMAKMDEAYEKMSDEEFNRLFEELI